MQPSYWCGTRQKVVTGKINPASDVDDRANYFEEEPQHLKAGIQLQDLTKQYASNKKVTVTHIKLNLHFSEY